VELREPHLHQQNEHNDKPSGGNDSVQQQYDKLNDDQPSPPSSKVAGQPVPKEYSNFRSEYSDSTIQDQPEKAYNNIVSNGKPQEKAYNNIVSNGQPPEKAYSNIVSNGQPQDNPQEGLRIFNSVEASKAIPMTRVKLHKMNVMTGSNDNAPKS
jgi:hypothetical protein